ncbi:ABC transporter related [Beutenbergia cavernae DSM 12333]|uniref:ABC transporter related n=1 Tax=Beutenbergia cavernae (strain ATCC BAA-8 / DSM 12333 / CCUG 43141 / JCM 11478 / NBRC 16432 / NCIMB 13614 / HKI 0122) TaxID=471853 RepID=C5C3F8_BEUC1|nr:ABC transporter ATP-binding protein [Beutenbergia cavernae]ACQ79857.1 ABC transporter related [Beutenbergia cavernae DSM 12333]
MPSKTRAPRSTAVLRASGVLVGYGAGRESAVCPPIDVTLNAGKALAVVGANGTGKSTFLRAAIGLLEPFAGSIEVLGAPVDERDAAFRAGVASVLDDDAYFPALTVREHLLLVARGHGVQGASALVTELVEEFGLTDRAKAIPTALSSGQRRRLLLAAGLVRPRKLLVLDEPEQRLDVGMRDRLAERLTAECAAGGSVLMATHDPVLVRSVAHSALLIAEDAVRRISPDEAARAIEAL